MTNKARHRRVGKVTSRIRRLNGKLRKKYQKFKADEKALKAFQRGFRLGLLYVLILRPVQAIDSFEEFLERVLNETTPVETVGKLTVVKNWLQKLNLSDFRQCFTTFGLSKLVGCTPYYTIGFMCALLTFKFYKYWKLKDELDDYVPIYLGKISW